MNQKSKFFTHLFLVTALIVLSVGLTLADIPASASQKLPSPAARPGNWIPYQTIRKAASEIDESRITKMALGGYFFGVDQFNPNLSIKEPWLIRLFLDALRNAEWWSGNPEMAGNRRSYIAFYLKDQREDEDFKFVLNFGGFNEHYGPSFERALVKLAEFRVSELRNFVKRNAKEVISLSVTKGKTLTQPSDLRFVLKELTKIKTSDCCDYVAEGDDRKLTFTLKNGKQSSFYLCLREKPKEKPAKPDPFFNSAFYAMTQPEPDKK